MEKEIDLQAHNAIRNDVVRAIEARMVKAVISAEKKVTSAQLYGTAENLATAENCLHHMRIAFGFATETSVGSVEFELRLEEVKQNLLLLEALEAKGFRALPSTKLYRREMVCYGDQLMGHFVAPKCWKALDSGVLQ